MTEEPRALSIIYAPEDCPHRDYKERCHHRDNLDGICDYPHDFPDVTGLTKFKVILYCKRSIHQWYQESPRMEKMY